MARASQVCSWDGCPQFAVADGRCGTHRLTHNWDSSTRNKPKGWNITRKRVLRRDRYRCQVCGRAASEVDHIVCQAFGGGEKMGNLRALCRSCHKAKTNDEKITGKMIAGWIKDKRKVEIDALVKRWR